MTSNPYRFHFRSVWRFDASVTDVYAALERAEDYPSWWPQVREVRSLDELSGTARIRSVLPYDLRITGRATRHDPAAGVLEMDITGDVAGWARWIVRADGTGALVFYEQRVAVRTPLMRKLARPGRPFFRANHALMMRAGQRGLRRWLARGLDEG